MEFIIKINYPKTILNLRLKLNISQEELARILGVSFSSVNRWETGKYKPTKLAKVKLEHLFAEYEVMIEVKENA